MQRMKMMNFFAEIGIEDCTVEHMFSLGRPRHNGKHRPLLVKLSTEKEKWTILSRAKRLKNSMGRWVKST